MIRHENLKRYKEAWICAVAVICHSKKRPTEWWIQIPKNDPPDALAMNLVAREDGKSPYLSLTQIEVFEIRAFKDESIEKSIERKLGKKDYSGMMLTGFVRRKGIFDHEKVADYIQELKPKAFVIAIIASEENSTNFSYIQLFPECIKFKGDFGLFCKTTNQKDFIEMRRSMKMEKKDNTIKDKLTLIPRE